MFEDITSELTGAAHFLDWKTRIIGTLEEQITELKNNGPLDHRTFGLLDKTAWSSTLAQLQPSQLVELVQMKCPPLVEPQETLSPAGLRDRHLFNQFLNIDFLRISQFECTRRYFYFLPDHLAA